MKSNLQHLLLIPSFLSIYLVSFGQDGRVSPKHGDYKYNYQERIITREIVNGYTVRDSLASTIKADSCMVSGIVTTVLQPMPFSQMVFKNGKGRQYSSISDINGNYQITVPPDTFSISFSCLGFEAYTIKNFIAAGGQIRRLDIDMGRPMELFYLTVGSDSLLNEEEQKTKLNQARERYYNSGYMGHKPRHPNTTHEK